MSDQVTNPASIPFISRLKSSISAFGERFCKKAVPVKDRGAILQAGMGDLMAVLSLLGIGRSDLGSISLADVLFGFSGKRAGKGSGFGV